MITVRPSGGQIAFGPFNPLIMMDILHEVIDDRWPIAQFDTRKALFLDIVLEFYRLVPAHSTQNIVNIHRNSPHNLKRTTFAHILYNLNDVLSLLIGTPQGPIYRVRASQRSGCPDTINRSLRRWFHSRIHLLICIIGPCGVPGPVYRVWLILPSDLPWLWV